TGDAGGETEVVLDPGAGARLPAGRLGLEDENVEAFGCGVDGGGQPRRARAHDDRVPHVGRIDQPVQAEVPRDLLVGRVAEDGAPRDDDDGYLRGLDVEPLEQLFYVRVPLEVDVGQGLLVAGEELLDAERGRGMARAEEHHVRRVVGDDREPPEDEGPQRMSLSSLSVCTSAMSRERSTSITSPASRARLRARRRRPVRTAISPVKDPTPCVTMISSTSPAIRTVSTLPAVITKIRPLSPISRRTSPFSTRRRRP